MSRIKLPGLQAEAERALLTQFEALSRRIGKVEATPAVELAIIDVSFSAVEGQTLIIAPPSAGVSGLLPKPRAQNRFARIHFVFTKNNPVTLSCQGGTVNGETALVHDVAGAYTAVCDGASGWWLESLELAAHLRGIGLTVDSNGNLQTRIRPRHVQLQDYFCTGTLASGTIGALGWNLLGVGTPAVTKGTVTVMGSTNRIGMATSGAANDRSSLVLGTTETLDILPATEVTIAQCAWNHDNSLTNKRIFFGLLGTFATDPAASVDCLGVYYDSAVDSHYQIIARASSTGSPTVTTRSVPANTAELMTIWQASAGVYQFYSGATLLGSLSTNIPTAAMAIGFRLETLAAAAKQVNLGYFGLEAVAGNAFDDDTMLDA